MKQDNIVTPPEYFIPRDSSWLMFNERVLMEAEDKTNPFLERLRFLAIFSNNLDEFLMVRYSGLKNLVSAEFNKKDNFGFYPQEILEKVNGQLKALLQKFYALYKQNLTHALPQHSIFIKDSASLSREQKKFIKEYFDTILYPIMTPLAVDQGHPFPVLPSKTMAFAVHIKRRNESNLAILPVPKNVPRILRLPSAKEEYVFILIEDIVRAHLDMFFNGYKINDVSLFRLVKDSELVVEEEFATDLLKAIEGEVHKRNLAKVVYLETEEKCSPELSGMLSEGLNFPHEDVVKIDSHFDLTFLFEIIKLVDKPELSYTSFVPGKMAVDNIFDHIKKGDCIIHLPYQSFDPTVDLVKSAATDPHVLAIKMTLYRTNSDSAIIDALKEAAYNKKQVTILVEIKARFDEANNIKWAKQLEAVGCHVIYGIPGLKVHSKMTLIVREEEGKIQRYVHLSTGNYNEHTARVYSDIGYFTANEDFAKDISDAFNVITGYSRAPVWKRIVSSPDNMRGYLTALIDREIKFHEKYKNGAITLKINSLEDDGMIEKLYEASQAGVKIHLNVRGICCLVPGIKGLSDNIKVKSIVGRFLEHSRILIFNNNGSPRVFLSSADWMRRNLDKRIELLFEVQKEEIKEHIKEIMKSYWKDNVKSWWLTPNKVYEKMPLKDKEEKFNCQEHFIKLYGV